MKKEKKTKMGDELASLSLIKAFVKCNAFGIVCDAGENLRQSWSEKEEQKAWEKFESLVVPTLADYSEMKDFDIWEEYSSFIGNQYLGLTESQFYEKVYKEFELEKETDGCKTYSELVAKIENLQKAILAPAAGSFSNDGVAMTPSFFIYV